MIAELADRFLRAASLVVTDRRWAATLSATALGFGVFVGVAIGPGAAGTLATGTQRILMPSPGGGATEGDGGGKASALAGPARGGTGGGAGGLSSEPLPPPSEAFVPVAAAPPPPAEEKTPARKPPAGEEDEEGEATELKGTVVHANPAAGSYALAIEGGELVPVHAAELPRPGAKLAVEALQLANGTFAEGEEPRSSGRTAQARVRGVVTFVDPGPLGPAYTLSGRGASLRVEVSPDPSGAPPPLPVLGARVAVATAIEPKGVLRQRAIEVEPGEPSTYLDLAGVYGGLSAETGQLLLSADGTRAGEADLALTVPASIETARLRQGDSYLATAEVESDGSLKLTGIASDERRKGADDGKAAQGDLKR